VPFPMVLTTNYDDVLEHRLTEAGLPYHLFSYQADGPHRGLFYHWSAESDLRIIERPRNIRALSEGFVLVKLNGGFDREGRVRESYITTRLDYWDVAARIPGMLPGVIRQKLSADPLLFLGSSLSAPDIESLVRYAHKEHPGPRSWAIVLKKSGIEYWQQCGVEILNKDVDSYVSELRARLVNNGSGGVVNPPRSVATSRRLRARTAKAKSSSRSTRTMD
jgi:SIR2-like domain